MVSLIFRRLLSAIPTLLVIIGVVFTFSQYIPGDPVEAVYELPKRITHEDSIAYQIQHQAFARELGLDKPIFFFSLSDEKGFSWNGFDNQYVRKVKDYVKGNFGNSNRTKKSVWEELSSAILWTFSINFIALLLVFNIGIYLGLQGALYANSQRDKWIMRFSFFSDAVPSFWIATILVVFFTTSYYGIQLFPSIGLGNTPYNAPFIQKFIVALPHLILPILIIIFGNISVIIRQMRSAGLEVISQDYIRTGKAKGLNDKQLIKNHIFPNAIFPILTLIGMSFPALITGSFIIENIFNIPGMGKLSIDAILNKDFPILFTVILLTAIMTILGNIISDILLHYFNPKLKNNLG